MKIIVGLGNPTPEYEKTFHNMGFLAIDALAEKLNKKVKKAECSALTATFSVKGETVVLAKPLTYMNLSGKSVKSLMAKYNAQPEDVVVLFDDFDIPRFNTRAREAGSGGTHNGMRNIVQEVGSQQIKRIRIGIGQDIADKITYVLSAMKKEDAPAFNDMFNRIADALTNYLNTDDFSALMRTLNVK